MTKAQMKVLASRCENEGEYLNTSGNEIWKHNWYRLNGFLVRVTFKNGKFFETVNLGR